MKIAKLFSWFRGGLVQGPPYVYYLLFWWLYTERTLRSKAAISPYSRIRKLQLVKSGIVIGEGTEVGFGSFILGVSRKPPSVTFGKRVAVAPYVVFVASSYPDNSRLAHHPEAKGLIQKTAPIVVEDDAWIGAHAVVFPGVTVGAFSIVAAGAVVRQDVPPKSIVAGVPAKVIRTLD